jgi:Ca2+-binding EF-hand superfamily protein
MPFEAEEKELQDKVAKLVQANFHGDYKAAFDYYADQPCDRKINQAKLVQFLSDANIGNWITRGQWAAGIIAELDTDHDGTISWDEFKAALT